MDTYKYLLLPTSVSKGFFITKCSTPPTNVDCTANSDGNSSVVKKWRACYSKSSAMSLRFIHLSLMIQTPAIYPKDHSGKSDNFGK